MNNWDQENLRFLMQANEAQLKLWQTKLTPDDMAYAAQLLKQASDALKSPDWRIIADMVTLPEDYNMDLTEANKMLAQFRL